MLCPYCQVQYTPEEPCFCQPRTVNQRAGTEQAKIAQSKTEGFTVSWESSLQTHEVLCAKPLC